MICKYTNIVSLQTVTFECTTMVLLRVYFVNFVQYFVCAVIINHQSIWNDISVATLPSNNIQAVDVSTAVLLNGLNVIRALFFSLEDVLCVVRWDEIHLKIYKNVCALCGSYCVCQSNDHKHCRGLTVGRTL